MSWKICFQLPDLPVVCIPIPVLFREFKIGPDPRWIVSELIDQKVASDLSVLATIDSLASQLSNSTVKKAVQSAIQSGVDSRLLKGNAKIEFR